MKNFLIGFFLAAILVSGGYWITSRQVTSSPPQAPQKAAPKYHCPMHPSYVSDTMGDCPICGMKLVPIEGEAAPQAAAGPEAAGQPIPGQSAKPERKILYYTDAMNPGSRYEKPGKAPDGMNLVPVYAEEAPGDTGTAIPGYAPLHIPPERLQTMGITVEEARVMSLDQSIRTVGIVTADETRTHHIHTKFEGYIDSIYVNYIGEHIRAGQPLFTVYSPELVATQREYLLALKAVNRLGLGDRLPGIDLVGSARQRLALWDISADQIAQIEKTGEPIRALTIYSLVSGFVTAKTAVDGMRITPADTLYDIQDLSAVWIMADLYEAYAPFVKIGDPATITLPYTPGRVLKGRVDYINPTLDDKSRTLKARIELSNLSEYLKPDMFTEVVIGGRLGRGIVVPDSAVMGTGEREIVFIAKGGGHFEPREVKTGVKVRGYYEIKKGVAAGEKVVIGANFMLDSESKLKAAISGAGKTSQE
jgi:Cu(I)/Ag(I) efflux system membrane fusion protein